MTISILPTVTAWRTKVRNQVQKIETPVQTQTNTPKAYDIEGVMEKVLLAGDLSKMENKDRINYYFATCQSLGMNPLTKPFDLITLNGKMVLYPNRSGTDQLRKIGNVSVHITENHFDEDTDCYVVKARAKLPSGREDEDMGIVFCGNARGDALGNAQMKAVTKAKRRVTLSIIGLGWVDESEVGTIKGAKLHTMDLDTGDVIDVTPAATKILPKEPEMPQGPPKETEQGHEHKTAVQKAIEGAHNAVDERRKSELPKPKPQLPKDLANAFIEARALVDHLKIKDEDLKEMCHREFGTQEVKKLNIDQVKALIDILKNTKDAYVGDKTSSRPEESAADWDEGDLPLDLPQGMY